MDGSISKPLEIGQLRRVLDRYLPPLDGASEAETPAAPAPRFVSAPSDLPPIDPTALASLFDDDMEFVRQLLDEFVASNTETQERLAKAFEAQAWDEVRQAAHKLAGSSRTVGARDLAAVGDAIELACVDMKLDGVGDLVARTAQELGRVAAFVERM